MTTLSDLGERKIINEILAPRYIKKGVQYFGNDCALIFETKNKSLPESSIIVGTTDPCPTPMASILGFDDYYYWGWLLATINLSDIAASGATPLGLLTSYNLPNHFTLVDFLRLLDGVDDCCSLCDTHVIGGNMKESPNIQLSATAFGISEKTNIFSRSGGKDNDCIIVIGDLGLFWAGVLSIKKEIKLTYDQEREVKKNILKPLPKVKIASELARFNLLNSCIDNSDGLYPSLLQLSESNKKRVVVNFKEIQFPEVVLEISSILKIDPIRLALGWGDWQLIGITNFDKVDQIKQIGNKHGIPIHVIGRLEKGDGVYINHDNIYGHLMHLDSERFTKDSWFTAGIETYIETFLTQKIVLE